MIKRILFTIALATVSTAAMAVPVLQLGVQDGSGYVAYTPMLTMPDEDNTAVTSGNTLLAAGAFGNGNGNGATVVAIGGPPAGSTWTAYQNPNFTTKADGTSYSAGAVLMATVPGLYTSGMLTVADGGGALVLLYATDHYSPQNDTNFVLPSQLSNHAPLNKDPSYSYLFFDVGTFSDMEPVPDFADPMAANASGEIKELSFVVTGFDWVHFDLLAVVGVQRGGGPNGPTTVYTLEGNPSSHDVTWKDDDGGGDNEIPEPGTLLLFGSALAALGLRRRLRS